MTSQENDEDDGISAEDAEGELPEDTHVQQEGKKRKRKADSDESKELDVSPLEKLHLTDRHKDAVREKIALLLTYAVIIIAVTPIVGVIIYPEKAAQIRDVAVSIIPAVAGIYGAIIGFYFGEKR